MRTFHTNIRGDERGTTAIEFAIVGPVFILLMIGILYLCMCLSVVGCRHYAVEEGARCSDTATTVAYPQSLYFGPSALRTFTDDGAAACGHSVSGSINYVMNLGLSRITVPIAANACFP
jgi:Flp pilus assembly pilin Flp